MAFLAPLFSAALLPLAVPVIIHLTQRERKQIVEFPSLMFLQRIPYQSVRRRRIRDWPLLMMRLAATALIVLAFAPPFMKRSAAARPTVPARGQSDHATCFLSGTGAHFEVSAPPDLSRVLPAIAAAKLSS